MPAGSNLNISIPGPDDLHSGNIRTVPLPIAAGTYRRGEVLGFASGVYGKLTAAANAAAIMPFDVTLSAAKDLAVYTDGDFNQDALTLNGQALAEVKPVLAKVGILIRKWGAARTSPKKGQPQ